MSELPDALALAKTGAAQGELLDFRFARDVKLGLTGPLIDTQDVRHPGFASARDESCDDSEETT